MTLAEDGGLQAEGQDYFGRVLGNVQRLKEAVPIRGLPAIGTTARKSDPPWCIPPMYREDMGS